MKINVTTLSENSAGMPDVLAEWGLSMLVEVDGYTVLFDAGRSISVSHNADLLGVDLGKIEKIVLSHGHFDHIGGLHSVLSRMKKQIEVIAHPDIWENKYKHRQDQDDKFIGIPHQRSELESLGAVFRLSRQPVYITENILTTGEVPMVTEFEQIDSGLWVKDATKSLPDELLDDRALIIKTEAGLAIILGCAHRGMVNTIRHARQLTGVNNIYAVLGGAHLLNAEEEQVWQTIAFLKDTGVQKLGLCHCTGLPVMALLAQEFGDGFFYNCAGTQVELL